MDAKRKKYSLNLRDATLFFDGRSGCISGNCPNCKKTLSPQAIEIGKCRFCGHSFTINDLDDDSSWFWPRVFVKENVNGNESIHYGNAQKELGLKIIQHFFNKDIQKVSDFIKFQKFKPQAFRSAFARSSNGEISMDIDVQISIFLTEQDSIVTQFNSIV